MIILKKLAMVIAFLAAVLGVFQMTRAKGIGEFGSISIVIPSAAEIGSWEPIVINIPGMKGNESFDLNPQPGYDVTLLPNQTVHFAWSDDTAKTFVIKDKTGKKVFDCDISNKASIDLVPSELKLKTGNEYFWSVNGKRDYRFIIFDEQTENQLLQELAKMDTENLSPEECVLKKAKYLLMLSDEHPETFDFYWIIAQWMDEISPTDKELAEQKSDFLLRCSIHLDKES